MKNVPTVISRSEPQCPRPPTRLGYCSCYVYSPRGLGAASRRSRLLRTRLKTGDANWYPRYAARVHQQVREQGMFPGLFERDVILVPVPCCRPSAGNAAWSARRLAVALQRTGLAAAVWTGLLRRHAVQKSATAPDGERPSVWEHYESLTVEGTMAVVNRLLLVDDVVTRGRTLLGAAMRLREAFPDAEVRAFALMRTMGLVPEITQLLEPCQGEIRWAAGDAHREP